MNLKKAIEICINKAELIDDFAERGMINDSDKEANEALKVLVKYLSLCGFSNFVCPDCKGCNMVESNKKEVWCSDCEKNYTENVC